MDRITLLARRGALTAAASVASGAGRDFINVRSRRTRAAYRITSGLSLLLAVLLVFSPTVCSAQVDAWERVKLIQPGKRIDVKLRSGKSANGVMEEWSPEGLKVRQRNKTVQVSKADIAKVALVAGMSRGRRAAWAGGIGAGVGAAVVVAACLGSSDCDVSPAFLAAGGAIWFGGVAAGIAALIPQHREVVYTAP